MVMIRRWTTSILSSFDWMIRQVENHESLVSSAMKDMQDAGIRAQVQLKRVRQDGMQMRKRLQEQRTALDTWRERALKSSGIDEQKAIECLKRAKRTEKEIAELEAQEREHSRAEKQLAQDLIQVQERMQTLKQQRNLLRTRQSRAEALKVVQTDDASIVSEIDDIFERWDSKVSEYEARANLGTVENDTLEAEFAGDEEVEQLKKELEELKQKNVFTQSETKTPQV